jgi:hypothetical protein
MDFSQQLNDYMNIKRLRGVTPGRKESEAVFKPYFDRKFDVNMAGRRQVLAEQDLAARTGQQGQSLAWDKTKTMNELAGQKDIAMGRLATEKDVTLGRLATAKDISGKELAGESDIALNRLAAQKDITTEGLDWEKQKSADRIALERELTTGEMGWSKEKVLKALALEKELQTNALDWNREKTLKALAFEDWKRGLLIDQAGRNDTRATIGNVIGTIGGLGNMYATKRYMDRRTY